MNIAAIEAALASAERVTFTGSITPAFTRSPYSSDAALNPSFGFNVRTFYTTT